MIRGSIVKFLLHWVKHPSNLLRNKANSQKHPSIYESRRTKSIEDSEKTEGKGDASGQKGLWDQRWDQGFEAPVLTLMGLRQDSWETAWLSASSLDKQCLSNTLGDLVA